MVDFDADLDIHQFGAGLRAVAVALDVDGLQVEIAANLGKRLAQFAYGHVVAEFEVAAFVGQIER